MIILVQVLNLWPLSTLSLLFLFTLLDVIRVPERNWLAGPGIGPI